MCVILDHVRCYGNGNGNSRSIAFDAPGKFCAPTGLNHLLLLIGSLPAKTNTIFGETLPVVGNNMYFS